LILITCCGTDKEIDYSSASMDFQIIRIGTSNSHSIKSLKSSGVEFTPYKTLVWFDKDFVEVLRNSGLPYPHEWCMFMKFVENDTKAKFAGSMGGTFEIPIDKRCISRHGK